MGRPEHVPARLDVIGEIARIDRLEPLDAYPGQVLELITALLSEGVDALEVTRAVADANDTLTRRLLGLAESHLGPAPCRYAWLALGSQGRGEQVLSSDQDSAIAYENPRRGDEPAAVHYFAALADLVVTALAQAGVPLCDGGYMATNWCRPVEEYGRLFTGWLQEPEPESLLRAEVFLDVRPVYGDLSVEVLDRILASGASRPLFLVMMARAAVTFRPPLGLFGRLRTRDGAVDVKRGGTAAIVLLARLYALAAGSTAPTTTRRLGAAADTGTLNRAGAQELTDAYRFLTGLRLRQQMQEVRRGRPPRNEVPLALLTAEERRRLRDVLRVVRDFQEVTASRFATHTVM